MDVALWVLFPAIIATASVLVSYTILSARLEVAVAKERESHASTHAKLRALEQSIPDKICAAEEAATRKALDKFMLDFRVEERRYLRENRSSMMNRRAIVTQERLYFRNIPLSNWVEQELPIEEGAALTLIDHRPVFTAKSLEDFASVQQATSRYAA